MKFAFGVVWLFIVLGVAGQQGEPVERPPDKALRYLELLRRRPQSDGGMDRLIASWLVAGSMDGLRAFLKAQTERGNGTAADHYLLALFLVRQGDDAAALEALQRARDLSPKDPGPMLERARIEARALKFEDALHSLEAFAVLAADESLDESMRFEADKLRIRLQVRTNRSAMAVETLKEYVADGDEEMAEELISLLAAENLFEEAEKALRGLIGRSKDAYDKLARTLELGDLQSRQGQRDAAVEVYTSALEMSGQDTWAEAEALDRIEQAYRREDDLRGLNDKLTKLAESQPQRLLVSRKRARVLLELGDGDAAVKVHLAVLARAPGRNDLRIELADLQQSLGRVEEAIEQVKSVLATDGTDGELRVKLAALHHAANQDELAQKEIARFLADPAVGEVDYLRGARLLESWSLLKGARELLDKMIQTWPSSFASRDALAQFLYRNDDREGAVAMWRSIALGGTLEDATQVARALMSHQDNNVALELLEKRLPEAVDQPRFLTLYVEVASVVGDYVNALPKALRIVELARGVDEISSTVSRALVVVDGAKQIAEVSRKLAAKSSLTINERCLLSALRESARDPSGAEQALDVGEGKDALIARQMLVRLWQKRGHWTHAGEALEKVIALPEGRTTSNLQRLVELRQRAGRDDLALPWVAEWKKISPGAVSPWLVEAQILSRMGRSTDGLGVLRQALLKFDDSPELAGAYADMLIANRRPADAAAIYQRWYEKSEDLDAKLRWVAGWGRAAEAAGQLPALKAQLVERSQKNAGSPLPLLALGEVLRIFGDYDGYRESLASAARLRPKDLTLLLRIAKLDEDAGRWRQALVTLELARQLETKGTIVRERIAGIQLRYGDQDAGWRGLLELVDEGSMDARAVEGLADSMCGQGEWERAAEFLEPRLDRHPLDYRLHYLFGVILEECGRDREAIQQFLRAGEMQGELPGATPQRSFPVDPLWIAEQARVAPVGTLDICRLLMQQREAFVYRTKSGGAASNAFSSRGASSYIDLPRVATLVPTWSLLHVIAMAQSGDASLRGFARQQLLQQGLMMVDVLLDLPINVSGVYIGPPSISVAILEKHPDDLPLWEAWLLNASFRFSEGFRSEEPRAVMAACEMAFGLFHEKYPSLAIVAAAIARREMPNAVEGLFDRALELLSQVDADDPSVASALADAYFGKRADGGRAKVPVKPFTPDQVARVAEWLRQPGAAKGLPLLAQMFSGSTRADFLIQLHRWADFVALANAEVNFYRQRSIDEREDTLGTVSLTSRTFSDSLPLPAREANLPILWLSMCKPPYGLAKVFGTLGDEGRAEARTAGGAVEDPLLRRLVLCAAGDSGPLKNWVEMVLADDQAGSDDLTVATWCAAEILLEKPLSLRGLVRLVQSGLVADSKLNIEPILVMTAGDIGMNGMSADDLREARAALLRLRVRPGLSAEQWAQLANSSEGLGMKEAAEELQKLATAVAPKPALGIVTRSRIVSTPSVPAPLLERLVASDQKEAALREALHQMRACSRELAADDGSSAMNGAKKVLEVLRAKDGWLDDLLVLAKPSDQIGRRQGLEYAGLLELCGREEAAQEAYSELAQRFPRDPQPMVRLVVLLSARDPGKAAEAWARAMLPIQESIARALAGRRYSFGDAGFSHRLSVGRTVTQFLRAVRSDAEFSASPVAPAWLLDCLDNLTESQYLSGGVSVPALLNSDQQATDTSSKVKMAIQDRRVVFDALKEEMLRFPALAVSAFGYMAALARQESGPPWNDVAKKAEAVLRLLAPHGGSPRVLPLRGQSFGFDTSIWKATPWEFLLLRASVMGKSPLINDSLRGLFPDSDGRGRSVQKYVEMWTCKEADFPAAALAWTESGGWGSGAEEWLHDEGFIVNIVRVWRQRAMAVSLNDVLLSALDPALGNPIPANLRNFAVYLSALVADGKSQGADEFFDMLVTGSLGEKTARKSALVAVARQQFAPSGNSSSSGSSPEWQLLRFIESLCRDPALLPVALRFLKREGLGDLEGVGNWVAVRAHNLVDGRYPETAAAMVDFLGPVEKPGSEDLMGGSATASRVWKSITGIQSQKKDASDFIEVFKKRPQSASRDLALALLDADPGSAIPTFVHRYAEVITAMSEVQRHGLKQILADRWEKMQSPGSLSFQVREELAPLLGDAAEETKRRIEVLDHGGNLDELKLEDGEVISWGREMLAPLVTKDPGRAAVLFDRLSKLIELKLAAGRWSGGNNRNGWSPRSELLKSVAELAPSIEMTAWSLNLMNQDTGGQLSHYGYAQQYGWGQSMYFSWHLHGGPWHHEVALAKMLGALHAAIGEARPELLWIGMVDFARRLPTRLKKPTIKWAEDVPASDPRAGLAALLALAARLDLHAFVYDEGGVERGLPPLLGMRTEDWQRCARWLDDERLNPRVRLALGHLMMHLGRGKTGPEIVFKGTALACTAMEQGWAFSSYCFGDIVAAFNDLPRDEVWKNRAGEIWAAWLARRAIPGGFSSEPRAVYRMHELALLVGENGWHSKMMTDYATTLKDSHITVAGFLRASTFEGMRSFLTSQGLQITRFRPGYGGRDFETVDYVRQETLFDVGLTAPRDVFLPKIGTDMTLYLGELMTAFLYDLPSHERWTSSPSLPPSKVERMTEAARRFTSIGFGGEDGLRERALAFLTSTRESRLMVKDALGKEAVKPNALLLDRPKGDSEIAWRLRTRLGHAMNRAEAGDPETLRALLQLIDGGNFLNRADRDWAFRHVIFCYFTAAREHWCAEPKGDFSAWLQSADEVLNWTQESSKRLPPDVIVEAASVKTALMLFAGKKSELSSWRATLSEQLTKDLGYHFTPGSTVFACLRALAGPGGRSEEDRLALIRDVLTDPWVSGFIDSRYRLPRLATQWGVLTRAELARMGMGLATAAPRDGRSFAEMAEFFEEEGDAKACIAALDAAMKVSTDEGFKNTCRGSKRRVIQQSGRQ